MNGIDNGQIGRLSLPRIKSLANQLRGSWLDRYIVTRDGLLNRITGAASIQALNLESRDSIIASDGHLAEKLLQILTQVKVDVMDEMGGKVDYAALELHPLYREYRREISPALISFDPKALETDAQKEAFWINLYHALVLDAVIQLRVKKRIGEGWLGLLGFFRKAAYIVGGYRVSLEDIEHGFLRSNQGHPFIPGPQFSVNDPRLPWAVHVLDPRIHFALNCASLSCPPIGVYNAEHIDEQLNLAARSFIDAHLTLDPVRQKITLSSIFRWFRRDFGGREGIVKFIANNLSPNDTRRAWLLDYQETIRFAQESYDWRLNRRLEEKGF